MKRFKVSEIIKMLEADGWSMEKQKGSHRQYKHSTKKVRLQLTANQVTHWINFF